MRGSILVDGAGEKVLELSEVSLKVMTGAVRYKQVINYYDQIKISI